MKKGVAYTRFSSDMQSVDSTEAQLQEIQKYANTHDIQIIKIYSDEAISGKTDKRPALQQMLSDAKKGLFDIVLVHKVDRFGRDRYDSAIHKAQLKRQGVSIQYAGQSISDNPEGRLMEGILESFAQYYSENLANETMKGLKVKARRAEFNGGIPPLGYDVLDKKYVINEVEARVVKLIFDMHASGKTYGEIFASLKFKGYKTKRGADFTKNSLHSILNNEKYIGIYSYNKTAPRLYGKRNSRKQKDLDEIIRIPDAVPKIIDLNTWNLCQERMKSNRESRAKYRAKVTYLLSGIIYCECDSKMHGNTRNNGYHNYHYYRCAKGCPNSIQKDTVEDFVLYQLYETYFTDKAIKGLTKKLNEFARAAFEGKDNDMVLIRKDLKRVETEIINIVNAISTIGLSEALTEKLKDLEQVKRDLSFELIELEHSVNTYLIPEDAITELLGRYKTSIEERNIEECSKFIRKFVKRVTVSKDDVFVEFLMDYITQRLELNCVRTSASTSTAPKEKPLNSYLNMSLKVFLC
ncbi:recombinase family protein [Clostridium formicaceticum]|uniref:Transposon gamma-delta resolvase n=1 Tax=Clostridium formicaceticum TaxID=1497 RepID=A0AAC9RK03_9CLOT|nr:recombinase family protein [Clostridium formicaceticum]AOY76657.1 hypothetical protein BJL90_12745 [Clostridium formicaceticum]ARE87082.1 Transposon gamma-delta resolvase [Clostridium formicaceticum]